MSRKGQNFLIDSEILDRIADYSELTFKDRVLEIGAGTGNLTRTLSQRAGRVFAVEVDRRLAAELRGRKLENVEIMEGDVLKIELPDYNKIVSNLPYQISSKATYLLLSRSFDLAVLMYQEEFARRIVARPGDKNYGRLSMIAGHLARAEILEHVPRSAFRPMPQVGSAIVRLWPKPDGPDINCHIFMRFVTCLFGYRRKKLLYALKAIGASKESLAKLDRLILDRRAEEISPDEAASIFKELLAASSSNRFLDKPALFAHTSNSQRT